MTPPGQYPLGVVTRYELAALCFALAVGVVAIRVNEWLMRREVA